MHPALSWPTVGAGTRRGVAGSGRSRRRCTCDRARGSPARLLWSPVSPTPARPLRSVSAMGRPRLPPFLGRYCRLADPSVLIAEGSRGTAARELSRRTEDATAVDGAVFRRDGGADARPGVAIIHRGGWH